jgi:hypothetical protein
MLRVNIEDNANLEYERSLAKWESRRHGLPLVNQRQKEIKKKNPLKGVPSNWIELINTQYKKCPKCGDKLTNRFHLLYKHGYRLKHVSKIWREEILPVTENLDSQNRVAGMSIREFNKLQLDGIIGKYLKDFQTTMATLNRPSGLKAKITPFI